MPASGFIWRLRDTRYESVQNRIAEGTAFTAVVHGDTRPRQIALIALDDDKVLNYASLMVSNGMVSTIDKRYRFSNFINLDRVTIAELAAALPGRLRLNLGFGLVPPATWQATLEALRRLRPHSAAALDALNQLVSHYREIIGDSRYDNVAIEKDAVGVALEIGGVGRSELTSWSPAPRPAPFLQGLTRARLYEDGAIANDVGYFGTWRAVRRYVVGAVEFHGEQQAVTVINVNRTRVERSSGVDLIYYHHQHAAYTLVQYKRMTREAVDGINETAVYRPNRDRSLEAELQRMGQIDREAAPTRSPSGYRLNEGVAFVKLCPPMHLDPTSAGLVRGMYFCDSSNSCCVIAQCVAAAVASE